MFYPKSDIFSQGWLDVIFEGRNKQYGAYVLRRDASKQVTFALFVAATLFIVSLLVPLIKSRFSPSAQNTTALFEKERIIEFASPPPIDKPHANLPTVAPPPPRIRQVRMPPPQVVPRDQVTEEPPMAAELKLVDPGSKTIDGNPDAAIHIGTPVGLGQIHAGITESPGTADDPFHSVEIAPSFPGGIDAFLKYVQKNYRYPRQAIEQGVKGRVILSFIVERDGSLTDIKIVRDLKFGTGEEAVRLLKASPKWSPGIQNGREVRVAYTLPIGLDISH